MNIKNIGTADFTHKLSPFYISAVGPDLISCAFCWKIRLNTFTSSLNQMVRAKTTRLHMVFHGNISSPVSATDPVKAQKTRQVL